MLDLYEKIDYCRLYLVTKYHEEANSNLRDMYNEVIERKKNSDRTMRNVVFSDGSELEEFIKEFLTKSFFGTKVVEEEKEVDGVKYIVSYNTPDEEGYIQEMTSPIQFKIEQKMDLDNYYKCIDEVREYLSNKYYGTKVHGKLKDIIYEGMLSFNDNYRYSNLSMEEEFMYELLRGTGCCGYEDRYTEIEGRTYRIGCNYGH